jgi:Cu(I)/Ag(I) efflux system membrane protein CusA/SilA
MMFLSLADLEQIVVKTIAACRCNSATWLASSLPRTSGVALPRSMARGEAATGIALQRSGANALSVIEHVKDRLAEILR